MPHNSWEWRWHCFSEFLRLQTIRVRLGTFVLNSLVAVRQSMTLTTLLIKETTVSVLWMPLAIRRRPRARSASSRMSLAAMRVHQTDRLSIRVVSSRCTRSHQAAERRGQELCGWPNGRRARRRGARRARSEERGEGGAKNGVSNQCTGTTHSTARQI